MTTLLFRLKKPTARMYTHSILLIMILIIIEIRNRKLVVFETNQQSKMSQNRM